MIIRAKSPLRIGLAGGGTDVSPYCDLYGGCVLNACITMYAYATIEPRNDSKIELISADRNEYQLLDSATELQLDDSMQLLKGVYNRVIKDFVKKPLSFTLTTYVDAPPGSGLGSSSTLVVAILKAFQEWQNLPLSEYDLAQLAWDIERNDLKMLGGKQDQYATAFGGFNFIEFTGSNVLVNPLRIRQEYINELEFNIILYYTGISRLSSEIIQAQVDNTKNKNVFAVNAMHKLKEQSFEMKEALLKGELNRIGTILDESWKNKKNMSSIISNPIIDNIYESALKAGASGGKISGAGGGGFFMFYCPKNSRYNVIKKLSEFGGEFRRFRFTDLGAESWIIK
ncbi:dehydrogenase [bacterium]|nr:dehydrogenase [bacterium]